MKNLLNVSIIVLSVIMITACNTNRSDSDGDQLSGTIKIDGSSTVYPVTEAVAEEFRFEHPNVNITVGVSGSGGGFNKFVRGQLDITDASRPIKENEKQLAQENDISYVELKVSYDGLAVIANPENDWLEIITVEELKKIWTPEAQNELTHWNQIRPEWPNEEIHLYGPGVASGTYDYFTEAIVGESGSSRGDYTASEDDNVLVQGIAGDKYGLGFFGLAYFKENENKLKLIAVDNGQGPVKPSQETVSNGSYEPLSRPMFIYVRESSAQQPEVQEFVHFYLDNADVLSREVGYVPLSDEEYAQEKEKFQDFLNENSRQSEQQ